LLGNLGRRLGRAVWNWSRPTAARRALGACAALTAGTGLLALWQPALPGAMVRQLPQLMHSGWAALAHLPEDGWRIWPPLGGAMEILPWVLLLLVLAGTWSGQRHGASTAQPGGKAHHSGGRWTPGRGAGLLHPLMMCSLAVVLGIGIGYGLRGTVSSSPTPPEVAAQLMGTPPIAGSTSPSQVAARPPAAQPPAPPVPPRLVAQPPVRPVAPLPLARPVRLAAIAAPSAAVPAAPEPRVERARTTVLAGTVRPPTWIVQRMVPPRGAPQSTNHGAAEHVPHQTPSVAHAVPAAWRGTAIRPHTTWKASAKAGSPGAKQRPAPLHRNGRHGVGASRAPGHRPRVRRAEPAGPVRLIPHRQAPGQRVVQKTPPHLQHHFAAPAQHRCAIPISTRLTGRAARGHPNRGRHVAHR
jgi:hypothetical protein